VILIAVLPATAFFRVGHTMQLESFIKYGQLQVALNTAERIHRDEEANAKQIKAIKDETQDETLETIVLKALQSARSKAPKLGVYQAFFFATEPVAASCDAGSGGETATSSASTVLPEMLEEFLPFYSESSVHMRELAHDRAPYRTWSWQHRGADLTFCMGDAAVPPFKSTVPVWSSDASAESIVTDLLVILILLSLIVAAVVWLVRFALHKVFVIDVIEPLWSGSTGSLEPIWGPNLFLVTGQPVADRMHASTFCHVDLACVPDDRAARAGWFDEQFDRIERSPAGQSVLLLHFEHRLQDPATDEAKLALLERIMTALNRTIVIVSAVPPGRFVGTGATAGASPTMAEEEARALGRWTMLLSKFTVVPVVAAATPPPAQPSHTPALGDWTTAGWREILWRISALGFAHSARFLEDERRDAAVGRLWKDVLPYAWHPDRPALDINQLLIEVGERSEHHYREIWETCTPAEKLVLGQIAEEGLVNEKTERTVRMLMARGLVRREPNFVVMNETFRQFVISASARAEVAMLEQQATSTWDAIRWPFMVLLIGSLTFFFATQHELFNTALGVLTGLAATLPALVKMASLFGGRKEAQ
jgi:hypothetical protein